MAIENLPRPWLLAALTGLKPIFYSWGWREGLKAADCLGLGVVQAECVVPRSQ